MKFFGWFLSLILIGACSTQPVLPREESVSFVRSAPDGCRELGKLVGRVHHVDATPEQALEDLRRVAADKGATHVQVMEYSGHRTAVSGVGFQCP